MALSRRRFLTMSGLAGASALLAACTPAPHTLITGRPALDPWLTPGGAPWRALNRLTFGPRPDELEHAAAIGLQSWIEEQLTPDSIADLDASLRVRRFDTLLVDASAIFAVREENARRELQQAALLRAVYSRRQLYEVMVDFWSDHFSISTLKGDGAWIKTIDDREVIRPHALGNFGDMLWASMHSPAMLQYLDNHENHVGNPNENYARELMELHTLGVDGGYSQRDVQQVARCLTGWTINQRLYRGRFQFNPTDHDNEAKLVLGQHIAPGGGERDGEQVFTLLMNHPATPRFVARKLVRRLVADDPPEPLVAAAADAFSRTRGDIKAMLRAILFADEFAAAPPKFKRPVHYVAGALRQLNAETDAGQPLLDHLGLMGQPLFQWPTPDGFPDYAVAWDHNLLPRWQFALSLATGALPGASIDLRALAEASGARTMAAAIERFSILLLGAPLLAPAAAALLTALGDDLDDEGLTILVAALLAAPAYQWR